MADSGSTSEMRHLAGPRAPARKTPSVSGGWVVMLLSGLIAAVLFLFATQQSSSKVAVAVMTKNVASGQAIDDSDLGRTEISASDAQLSRFIRFEDRGKVAGWVAAGPLEAGDIVQRSVLREPAAQGQRRSMSIPVDKSHANNGNLRAGDRIDVINADNADGYVARGLEVLSVETSGTGGLGAAQQFIVTVAVDEAQAVKVSQAVRGQKFDLVRTTGVASSAAQTAGTATTVPGVRPGAFQGVP